MSCSTRSWWRSATRRAPARSSPRSRTTGPAGAARPPGAAGRRCGSASAAGAPPRTTSTAASLPYWPAPAGSHRASFRGSGWLAAAAAGTTRAGEAAVVAAEPGRQVGGARPGGARGVAGVGDGAPLERQAAAADARVEAIPQGGERGDLVVEPPPPATGEPGPVGAGGGPAREQ